jgi:hypothetical protein
VLFAGARKFLGDLRNRVATVARFSHSHGGGELFGENWHFPNRYEAPGSIAGGLPGYNAGASTPFRRAVAVPLKRDQAEWQGGARDHFRDRAVAAQIYRVSLLRQHVQGIVFWTKNLGPFLARLPEVRDRGFPFVIQYSINGYPRTLEFSVVDSSRSVEHMKLLAGEYGPKIAVWRYDPIVFSSVTSRSFHLENFEKLARSLQGCTDEATISVAQIYKKTRQNMD